MTWDELDELGTTSEKLQWILDNDPLGLLDTCPDCGGDDNTDGCSQECSYYESEAS